MRSTSVQIRISWCGVAERFVALYALPVSDREWFFVMGDTETATLPFGPSWVDCMTFEHWLGRTRPETDALCRKLGIDVLYVIHIQPSARGSELRAKLGHQQRKEQHAHAR